MKDCKYFQAFCMVGNKIQIHDWKRETNNRNAFMNKFIYIHIKKEQDIKSLKCLGCKL